MKFYPYEMPNQIDRKQPPLPIQMKIDPRIKKNPQLTNLQRTTSPINEPPEKTRPLRKVIKKRVIKAPDIVRHCRSQILSKGPKNFLL